jgi:glycosyltransferase involved in cell wall biosynthesis
MNLKIVFVLNHFLPDNIAGTEIYVKTLASFFLQSGHQSIVIIPNHGISKTVTYFFEGIKVIKYAEPSIVDRALIMGKRQPDGLKNFLEIIKGENPDIIHFHELAGSNGITLSHVMEVKQMGFKIVFTAHLASYSCKTGNLMYKDELLCDAKINVNKCTKCVLTIKNKHHWKTNFLYPISQLNYLVGLNTTNLNSTIGTAFGYHFIIKKLQDDLIKLVNNCDKFVVLTDWYKQVLTINNVDKNKLVLIKQGLPSNEKVEKNNSIASLPINIIFIGRISHFKGLHILLEAFSHLPSDKIVLNIYGKDNNDEYAKECKFAASKLNNVHWHNVLEPTLVLQTIVQNDILCLPSTFSEMSPLVIQEAFAAGTPVLASNVYGNAEQITDNKNGWLFNFNDEMHLITVLKKLIEEPSLIDTAKTNINAVRLFSKVGEEYDKIYREVLHECI